MKQGRIRVPATIFPIIYSLCSAIGMIICLIISYQLHWAKVLKNHCRVYEYFPSVSSVIGDYSPEKNVWRTAIGFGSGPFAIKSYVNYQILRSSSDKKFAFVLAIVLDVIRYISAAGWTFISSSEYLLIHEVFFIVYVASSFFFAIVHSHVFYHAKIKPLYAKGSSTENDPILKNFLFSYRFKIFCIITQAVMAMLCAYIFVYDHGTYCLPGAYSRYAICEWTLSTCNILYDLSSYLDCKGLYFTLNTSVEIEQKQK